jgi:hypothetical protein
MCIKSNFFLINNKSKKGKVKCFTIVFDALNYLNKLIISTKYIKQKFISKLKYFQKIKNLVSKYFKNRDKINFTFLKAWIKASIDYTFLISF